MIGRSFATIALLDCKMIVCDLATSERYADFRYCDLVTTLLSHGPYGGLSSQKDHDN